jgi:hypothetical protein
VYLCMYLNIHICACIYRCIDKHTLIYVHIYMHELPSLYSIGNFYVSVYCDKSFSCFCLLDLYTHVYTKIIYKHIHTNVQFSLTNIHILQTDMCKTENQIRVSRLRKIRRFRKRYKYKRKRNKSPI